MSLISEEEAAEAGGVSQISEAQAIEVSRVGWPGCLLLMILSSFSNRNPALTRNNKLYLACIYT